MDKKKGNGYGKGTFVETKMFLSKAFLNLGNKGTSPTVSTASHKILMMLLGKRQYSYIKENSGNKKRIRSDENKFTLTYKELENYGIKQNTATRGIDELLAKGFISILDPGGAFEKHKAAYALEEDYLLWYPKLKQVFRKRERDILRGYQRKNKTKIACVDGGHPHVRQRGTPPIEDTCVNGGHPPNSNKRDKIDEAAC